MVEVCGEVGSFRVVEEVAVIGGAAALYVPDVPTVEVDSFPCFAQPVKPARVINRSNPAVPIPTKKCSKSLLLGNSGDISSAPFRTILGDPP
ncbi:MAG: hypothetical protein WBX15_18525 [Thermoanaerobaculia bacterium]